MHLILCSTIDPKKYMTKLAFHRAEFLYLVVVQGEPDMASYIYQTVRVEALKTDTGISLPYDILLTHLIHIMLVPKGANEPKALPLRQINKVTLSCSMVQTCQVLSTAQAAAGR